MQKSSCAARGLKLRLVAALAFSAMAAIGLTGANKMEKPVIMTAEQDHQNMMDQLGIKTLRPGVQNDVNAKENPVNYDEKKANPWPNYPDPLMMQDGTKVTTADQWWNKRRPELVEIFEKEIYGRIPPTAPKVTWKVDTVDREFLGFTPIVATRLMAHADNSAYPAISLDFPMMLIKPAQAKGPMPVLIMFTFGGLNFPAPAPPSKGEFDKINKAWKQMMVAKDPSLKSVFEAHPAWQPFNPPPFSFPQPDKNGDLPALNQFIADGWAVAMIEPNSIQADSGAGLTQGVIGLSNHGQPRKPEDWGVLRAWAWGASRALDYLETDPDIDAKHVGIEGVSRYGKAALVAMTFDQRFGLALVASSGESGTKPHRRNYGETVENQAATAAYHWMAGNFLKYAAQDSVFGSKNAGDIPIDAGELIALCAPRLTFISYGSPAGGDPGWVDQHGGFMATVQAGKVFRLLGAKDLGVGDDYQHAKMPVVNHGLLDGQLAWRQHDGGHTDQPNFKYFIQWADKMIGRTPPSQ